MRSILNSASEIGAPRPDEISRLSDREEQVVRLVCEGLTNRQIAERLGVSKRTIEFFRANAMRKLGAHNAKELQHRFQLKY